MSLNDRIANLTRKGREAYQKTKTEAIELAVNVRTQVDNRTGVIGGLATVVNDGVEASQKFHQRVQAKGGYAAVIDQEFARADKKLDRALDTIDAKLTRMENTLFTNGVYDSAKGKDLLSKGKDVTATYGSKAATYLGVIAKEGASATKQTFRQLVPTSDELSTTYAGIGKEYSGFLFRQHYDECLKFHDVAVKAIPASSHNRKSVLADIKASASANLTELVAYYGRKLPSDETVSTRSSTARRYL